MKALSRLELEAIIGAIPTAVVVIGKESGRVIYANDRATNVFGVNLSGLEVPSQTDKLGKILTLSGEVYPYEKRPICQVFVKGQEIKDELIIQRPDSSRVVVSASARPVVDENGTIIAAVGVYEDITERKVFEEALEEEKQTLKGIIESTETMVAYFDKDFNFVIVNTAFANGSGYTVDQLAGKNHFKLFPSKENQEIFEEVRDTGKPVIFLDKPFEFANQPDRGVTYWDWTLTPVKNGDGTVCGLVLTLIETTERKKAEYALRNSEERFRLVAEAANVLVYETEARKDKVKIFRGEEVLGYGRGQMPTSDKWWLNQIHPDDKAVVLQNINKAMESGKDIMLEYRVKRKQGDYITVHDTVKMIVDEQGKVVRTVGGVRDITERKILQAKLEQYTKDLERTVEERTRQLKDKERLAAIGETAGMVGHDIRNPLQAMLSDVYLLKTDLAAMPQCEINEGVSESLESIEKSIGYVNKIVADLQDYARPLNPEHVSIELSELSIKSNFVKALVLY